MVFGEASFTLTLFLDFKKRLLQILTALPDETPVTAVFSYGRTFSTEHRSTIVGINVIENKDKTMTAVICAQEIKQEKAA